MSIEEKIIENVLKYPAIYTRGAGPEEKRKGFVEISKKFKGIKINCEKLS